MGDLVVDLSGVELIDATGLGVLLGGRPARQAGRPAHRAARRLARGSCGSCGSPGCTGFSPSTRRSPRRSERRSVRPPGPVKLPTGRIRAVRDQPWVMRTYAGHSSAAESNALYRQNLSKGQTGLSVAFDLPTQTGYDPDHELARGEVGKVGVPVSHLGDVRALFDGIPLAEMNTSMTINATAMWLLALYETAALEQAGVGPDDPAAVEVRGRLGGTTQNDIVKEYLSRGTYAFPPAASLRLTTDLIAYTVADVPRWNPINICSYHLQEAGATPVQEIAFAMSTAMAVLDAVRDAGQVPEEQFGDVVARISFFVNAGVRFVEEMCKMRALVALWDELTRDALRRRRPEAAPAAVRRAGELARPHRGAAGEQRRSASCSRCSAVTLSKDARARAVQLPAWNEALGLPRPWDQQWALRMQQVLAYESDLLEYDDLFAGSHGGRGQGRRAVRGRPRRDGPDRGDGRRRRGRRERLPEVRAGRLALAAPARRVESGDEVVVGVNRFTETEPSPLTADLDDRRPERRPGRRGSARWPRSRPGAPTETPRRSTRPLAAPARRRQDRPTTWSPATLACARAGVTTGEWAERAARGRSAPTGRPTGVSGAVGAARGRRGPAPGCASRPADRRRARDPAAAAGRQAGPGRALQRSRADRGPGPRRRLRGRLPGHPADPGPDRCRPPSRRACTASACRSSPGRTVTLVPDVLRAAARGRRRRRPGRGRRHRPGRRRALAARARRRRGVHAQGLRHHRHPRPDRRVMRDRERSACARRRPQA